MGISEYLPGVGKDDPIRVNYSWVVDMHVYRDSTDESAEPIIFKLKGWYDF